VSGLDLEIKYPVKKSSVVSVSLSAKMPAWQYLFIILLFDDI
jgi:hypothetical protein